MQKTSSDIAENAISDILLIAIDIDRKLLLPLFSSEKIKLEHKRSLFKAEAPNAKDDEIKQWLPCIENEEFLELYKSTTRPTFENTEWNKSLLEIFKKRGLIASYRINPNERIGISRKKKSNSIKKNLF